MKQNRREFMKSNLKAGALVALPMIFREECSPVRMSVLVSD